MNSGLSVVLLIGLILKDMPLKFLQPFLQKSMDVMQNKHSSIFSRVLSAQKSDNVFIVIDANDLPFLFYMKLSNTRSTLHAIKRTENPFFDAKIKGNLVDLLHLFEGKLDGDTAFFSKQLVIEGSTEIIVALRNAIDSVDINLREDLADIFIPFNGIAKYFLDKFSNFYVSIQSSINVIVDAVSYNNLGHIKDLEMKLSILKEEIENINKYFNKINREEIRKKSDYN